MLRLLVTPGALRTLRAPIALRTPCLPDMLRLLVTPGALRTLRAPTALGSQVPLRPTTARPPG